MLEIKLSWTTLQQNDDGQRVNMISMADVNAQNDGSGDCKDFIDKTKLIVNYIPQFTTEEELALVFTQIGPIESIRIMKNVRTGYSYGYGFVKYVTAEDAAKAIEALSGMIYRYSSSFPIGNVLQYRFQIFIT